MEHPSPGNASPADEGLRLEVGCPQCAASIGVPWSCLDRRLKCPKCKGAFRVTPTKTVVSEKTARQIPPCPRCLARLPKSAAGSAPATCPSCGMEIAGGEAESRSDLSPSPAHLRGTPPEPHGMPAYAIPRWAIAAGITIAAAIVAFSLWPRGPALEPMAEQLVIAAMKGDQGRALALVVPEQEGPFEYWRAKVFGNRNERVPADGKVTIDVAIVQRSAAEASLRVSIAGKKGRPLVQSQVWRCDAAGNWRFDPRSSLKLIGSANHTTSRSHSSK